MEPLCQQSLEELECGQMARHLSGVSIEETSCLQVQTEPSTESRSGSGKSVIG